MYNFFFFIQIYTSIDWFCLTAHIKITKKISLEAIINFQKPYKSVNNFFNRQLTWPSTEKFLTSPLNEGILLYWARNILNLYCCIQAMIHSDESMRGLIQLVILVYLI